MMLFSPYAILASGLLVLGALSGAFVAGERRQADADHVAFQKERDTATAALLKANEATRQAEHAQAQALAQVATEYQARIADEKSQHDKVLADLNAGTVRLRVKLAAASGSSQLPGATACPIRSNGAETAELSRETAEFLVDLAAEADRNTDQLTACQAVVAADRR